MAAIGDNHFPHWIGIRVSPDTLQLALMRSGGEACDQRRVSNDRPSIIRVLRHWNRQYQMDPARTMFCLEDSRPWSGAALYFLVARQWAVRIIPAELIQQQLPEGAKAPVDAYSLTRLVMRAPDQTEVFQSTRLLEDKLRHLRERRDHLMSLRNDFSTRLLERNQHLERELQREFERMDRRHMMLIDKLVARLDTLIALQMDLA